MTLKFTAVAAACAVAGAALANPFFIRGSWHGWGSAGQTPMVDQGDGRWTATLDTTVLGTVKREMKATNEDWSFSGPAHNLSVKLAEGQSITVTFWPDSPFGVGWVPGAGPRVGVDDWRYFGWELMGNFNGWSAPLAMNDLGNGLFHTTVNFAAGDVEFKFRKIGDWDVAWGSDGGDGPNILYTVGAEEAVLGTNIWFDRANGVYKVEAVPEPASMLALAVGAGLVALRRRRRS
ncbi:MAG: PEP-CTERM sorting domain-containing protein [Fimbriimonadaceae bacterium]